MNATMRLSAVIAAIGIGPGCSQEYDVCDWGRITGQSDAIDDLEECADFGAGYRDIVDELPRKWHDDELVECYEHGYTDTWDELWEYYCG